jgi:3-oxoacyl-[acyl-carrier protein] reductase
MNLNLHEKTALVTASTGGIGLEIARSLAAEGANVIINGRTQTSVDTAIQSIKQDVADAKLNKLQATIEKFAEVDILVNNLGIYEAVGFFDETDESWQRLFDVNIMSGVRLTRHYLRAMLTRNAGKVLFMSSESALNPAPEMAHYSATKTMQLSLSRSLAELTKGTNVTVNSVLPGSTRTEGVEKFVQDVFPDLPYDQAEKKFMQENRATSLIERLIDPQEIASFVTYLCSPKSSAINGAALRVDGGIVRAIS